MCPKRLKRMCAAAEGAAAEAAAPYTVQMKPLVCIQNLCRCWTNLSVVQVSEDWVQETMEVLAPHMNPMAICCCRPEPAARTALPDYVRAGFVASQLVSIYEVPSPLDTTTHWVISKAS